MAPMILFSYNMLRPRGPLYTESSIMDNSQSENNSNIKNNMIGIFIFFKNLNFWVKIFIFFILMFIIVMIIFNWDVFIYYFNHIKLNKFYMGLIIYVVIFVPIILNLFILYLIYFKEKKNSLPKFLSKIFPTFYSDLVKMFENKEVLIYYKNRGYREILFYYI